MAPKFSSGPSYLRILLGFVLVVGILYLAKSFIVPLALAVLLTFVLTPIVSALQRTGLRRVPAVLITVVIALGGFGIALGEVGKQVNALVQQMPEHKEKIKKKIAELRGSGEGALAKFIEMVREISEDSAKQAADKADPVIPEKNIVIVRPEESSNFEKLAYAAIPVLEPLATAGLVIVLVIFMLSCREDLRNRFISLLGHGHLTGTTRVLVDTAQRLSSFLLTQMLINVGFGIIFGAGLLVIGVPYAFLWGFLTGLLRFVPYIGTWISVAFPLILSFTLSPDWTQPVIVLAFFVFMELVVANAVEPLLFSHSTGVTPIALLVAAAFWTWVWGPIGLVLSTPLTVCLVVLGQHVPRFQFFALLLGDQPPLETHVAFYQRLLSRDADEARQIITDYIKIHGQEKSFDDVLMPAMILAGMDRAEQGLSAEDEDFIFQASTDILAKLQDDPGSVPSPEDPAIIPSVQEDDSFAAHIIACPAHQKNEELPLRMFGLLLKPEGIDVDVLSTRTLPVEIVERVATEKPAAVFIAVVPPGGLIQARYLCKRLRKKFAHLPIVVGYWGPPKNFDFLDQRLRSVGATYVTTSLLQACTRIRGLLNLGPPANSMSKGSVRPKGAIKSLPETVRSSDGGIEKLVRS